MKYRKRHARILAVMLSAVMLFSTTGSFLTSATTVETGGFTEETEIMDSGNLGDDFAETEEGFLLSETNSRQRPRLPKLNLQKQHLHL